MIPTSKKQVLILATFTAVAVLPGCSTVNPDAHELTADGSSACHTMASGCAQLETPLPDSPIQGTPEGNAKLIRYRAGVQLDANGNPINSDATGGRK